MIIPEAERSTLPLVGEGVFAHPDMVRANEYVLREYTPPTRKVCVFVPCAKVKPYHTSPSHRNYDTVIFSVLDPEEVHVIAFGTCGVTPRELDAEYPFAHYNFVLGDCNVLSVKRRFINLESTRLCQYLEKTRRHYQHRLAYCTGDFRSAMERACSMTNVDVAILPRRETLERHRVTGRRFEYGSLSKTAYLDELREALQEVSSRRPREVAHDAITVAPRDHDWYLR